MLRLLSAALRRPPSRLAPALTGLAARQRELDPEADQDSAGDPVHDLVRLAAVKEPASKVNRADQQREPDDALGVVDPCQSQPGEQVRTVRGDELRQHRDVKRADLGIEQVRGCAAEPRPERALGRAAGWPLPASGRAMSGIAVRRRAVRPRAGAWLAVPRCPQVCQSMEAPSQIKYTAPAARTAS